MKVIRCMAFSGIDVLWPIFGLHQLRNHESDNDARLEVDVGMKGMTRWLAFSFTLAAVLLSACNERGVETSESTDPQPQAGFVPPLAMDAPADAFGDAVRLGEKLMTQTATFAPKHVGNGLACSNCHLDAGRKAGAAPLWAAFVNFPAFRKKNGEINSFQKRVQDCFLYSMNGSPPALGSPELLAIESYSAFMARGLPSGISPPGRGFPKIADPALAPDDARGAKVFAEKCSVCHGEDGAGQTFEEGPSYPPLWGARSYNWGAGMATIDKAAAFIHANMPQGQEGSLTVQQAWDVATFIDGQVRPQDPRFDGNVLATRKKHHDNSFSRYGTLVGGKRLGDPASTPTAGSAG